MPGNIATVGAQSEQLPLSKAAAFLLNECRMVLPGVQALFGFQMVAIFDNRFSEALSTGEQELHLFSIAMVATAIALIMAPAAYHRQTNPHEVSDELIRLCTRLLLCGMAPLALGLCLDFYLVAHVILKTSLATWLAAGLLLVFVMLWFVLPRAGRAVR